jgi:alpha-tubulin suppressor-like RCC1 family protein
LGAGELGRGFRCRHQTTPVLVTTMSGKGTKEVSCGEFSSYAVTREGEFWAWGGNTMGQLGLGHTKSVDVPQVCPWLPKEECIRIAAGGFHTVLLCARNRVFSFGQNDKGVLGNGQRGGPECWTTPQLLEPLLGKGISDIKCGTFHGVALGHHQQTGRSRVYTWGWNSHGQLGLAGLSKVERMLKSALHYLMRCAGSCPKRHSNASNTHAS